MNQLFLWENFHCHVGVPRKSEKKPDDMWDFTEKNRQNRKNNCSYSGNKKTYFINVDMLGIRVKNKLYIYIHHFTMSDWYKPNLGGLLFLY